MAGRGNFGFQNNCPNRGHNGPYQNNQYANSNQYANNAQRGGAYSHPNQFVNNGRSNRTNFDNSNYSANNAQYDNSNQFFNNAQYNITNNITYGNSNEPNGNAQYGGPYNNSNEIVRNTQCGRVYNSQNPMGMVTRNSGTFSIPNASNQRHYDTAMRVARDHRQSAINTITQDEPRVTLHPLQINVVSEFEVSYTIYMEAEGSLNQHFARQDLRTMITSVVREGIAEAVQQVTATNLIRNSANMSTIEEPGNEFLRCLAAATAAGRGEDWGQQRDSSGG